MSIKKGDTVKVMTGKDRGKTAKVLVVLPLEGRVTVEGMNMLKRRTKPRKQGEKGQTVPVARPFNLSNVMLVCPNCKAATRVGTRVEGQDKIRVCKKCEARI